ncbi:MAG: class I SAM-dependent methyltransferase [Phycisphaerae bacterium]|nr:class I SAM-dependent methyltransferase [Phycisphaerae bacterium]
MKFRIPTNICLTVIVFTLAVWQRMSQSVSSLDAAENTATRPIAQQDPTDNNITPIRTEPNKLCSTKPSSRAGSIRALLSYLSLSEGTVVADIGAGSGTDTWTFANVVGKKGIVFAQEISEGKVTNLEKEAHKKGLSQVCPVLGRANDPCLPSDSADLVFVHHVYHHFARPREMLRGLLYALKPGGYLVVVDKRRGTLRDWVPCEQREKKHFWTAETTVVREAREEGFVFMACVEQCWHTEDDFVFIFQRPRELKKNRPRSRFFSFYSSEEMYAPVPPPFPFLSVPSLCGTGRSTQTNSSNLGELLWQWFRNSSGRMGYAKAREASASL